MRKTLLLLIVTVFFITCKKDKSPSGAKETVLSKMYFDNILVYDFIYSPQKQLTRINSYNEKTGKFEYASAFEYDAAGKTVKEYQYSSTNKLTGQMEYNYIPGGKLKQQEYRAMEGTDSGKITTRIKFSYDGTGRISQRTWVDLVTDLTEASNDFTYFDNNNLKTSSNYFYYNGKELFGKTEYTEGNAIPPSLVKHQGYPINFLLFDLVSAENHYYGYNNGAVDSHVKQTFNERKYDNNGFLLQQTISKKSIKPALPDEVIHAQYEYIKL